IIFGGEALNPRKLALWHRRYPGIKLVNMFGITETTVHVTYKEIGAKEIEEGKSNIGKPIPTLTTYVMNKDLEIQPLGIHGEMCVGGDGVGRGYLNRPELTAERFVTNPYKPGERLYRAGDRVRMQENGDMTYEGRVDQQVKIRGFRIEPAEIENQILRHPQVKEAVVIMEERDRENSDRYLCAFVVTQNKDQNAVSGLKEHLVNVLPPYMIPADIIQLPSLPLTSSGKLDRKALPKLITTHRNAYIPPGNEVEKELVQVWQEELALEKVGISDNYFNIGGDSINAVRLLNRINRQMETHLQLPDLYAASTIAELAVEADRKKGPKEDKAKKEVLKNIAELKQRVLSQISAPYEIEDIYPLSDIEMGMVFYYLKSGDTSVYHDQFVSPFTYEQFNPEQFRQAVTLMVQKHAMLRTALNIDEFEEPVHVVYKKLTQLPIEHTGISHLTPKQQQTEVENYLAQDKRKPFNAAEPPLWRMKIFTLDPDNICIVFVFHHALLDGWSVAALTEEFNTAYRQLQTNPAYEPPEPGSTYKTVVVNEILQKQNPETIAYWKNELEGYKRLNFTQRTEGEQKPGGMTTLNYPLGKELLTGLWQTAQKHNTSVKNICFAAYIYILHMLTNEDDIVAGSVTNIRPLEEGGDRIAGCFLNTVPVRIKIDAGETWTRYIKEVERKLLELKRYETLTLFEIGRITGEKNVDRNPIFDTIFNYMDFHVLTPIIREQEEKGRYGEKGFTVEGSQDTNTLFDFEVDVTAGNFSLCPKFDEKAIETPMVKRGCRYFEEIIKTIISQPGTPKVKNEIIPVEERQWLLYELNDTAAPYDSEKTMHQLFEEQEARTPGNTAVIAAGREYTYSEVNEKANTLARTLRNRGVKPGKCVAVISDRTMEMIATVMGIVKAGGVYVPLEPYLPDTRISKILNALKIGQIVTNRRQLGKIIRMAEQMPELDTIVCMDGERAHWQEIEKGPAAASKEYVGREQLAGQQPGNPEPWAKAGDEAYIIFTSGSTGVPKGVVETHRPVINIIQWVNKTFSIKDSDRLLFVTSLGFDLSVYDIFGILAAGATIRVAEAGEIKNAETLLEIIVNEGITFWDSAPAALQQLIPVLPQQSGKGKKKTLRLVFLSGDWIPVTMPGALKQAFEGVEVISLGGATEATIWSNYYPIGKVNPAWRSIPYGKPIHNAAYYILDQQLELCPTGVTGDLYIGGKCLASRYKGDRELTASKFIPNPYVTNEKMYKTGDCARYYEDGNMEFMGRKDHQVKIRGFRIELGEIENQLINHNEIEGAVVLVREYNNGEHYLCAYYVPKNKTEGVESENLKQYLKNELPEYMIPSYLIQLEKIPTTANGKLDRKALPEPQHKGEGVYALPRSQTEKTIQDIWAEILAEKPGNIGIDDNFFELGGHSLNATELTARIHKQLNVKIPLAEIFRTPTIRELSQYISSAGEDTFETIFPAPEKNYYPLSPAQKRMYIQQQMEKDNTTLNMTETVKLEGELNREKLERAFLKIIERHESFRTTFEIENDEPVQRIHPEVEFRVDYFHRERTGIEQGDEQGEVERFKRPFKLSEAPLLRVALSKRDRDVHILMMDMHHIISDWISRNVLIRELMALYAGEELPPLKITYKDYSQWQNERVKTGEIQKQEAYWLEKFVGKIPELKLPTDYPGEVRQGYEGDNYQFEINRGLTAELQKMVTGTGITLNMVLLAIYNILLSKYTRREDVVVGVPAAGRNHADLQDIIGVFVNTLAIRNQPASGKTFRQFLKEVKENSLEAYQNQDYQFDDLVLKLDKKNKTGSTRLFDTMLAFQETGTTDIEIEGLKLKPHDTRQKTSLFHLIWIVNAVEDRLECIFEYRTRIFKEQTIKRMGNHLLNIVEAVVKNPGTKISQIEMITTAEKETPVEVQETENRSKNLDADFDF
ncbi:MAG: amino acid adenylation domain-containing protein, partial [bacterium]|nr:amino acid adenylation domain-containing protein [bacterium]